MTDSRSQQTIPELRRKAALFREGTKRIYDGQGARADMWYFELWHFLGDVEAALSQSPATDAAARRDEIARIIDEHSFDTVKMHGRQNASQQSVRRLDDALAKADLILGGSHD